MSRELTMNSRPHSPTPTLNFLVYKIGLMIPEITSIPKFIILGLLEVQ